MLGLRENGSQLESQFLRYLKSDLETIVIHPSENFGDKETSGGEQNGRAHVRYV